RRDAPITRGLKREWAGARHLHVPVPGEPGPKGCPDHEGIETRPGWGWRFATWEKAEVGGVTAESAPLARGLKRRALPHLASKEEPLKEVPACEGIKTPSRGRAPRLKSGGQRERGFSTRDDRRRGRCPRPPGTRRLSLTSDLGSLTSLSPPRRPDVP